MSGYDHTPSFQLVFRLIGKLAQRWPESVRQEFVRELADLLDRLCGAILIDDDTLVTISKLLEQSAELKAKWNRRNRKSSTEIINRNIEICDLRHQNQKHWSLSRLATKYKCSVRNITKILEAEDHWRKLGGRN